MYKLSDKIIYVQKLFILAFILVINISCSKNKDEDEFARDGFTYVPDDNFEQALINLGYDDLLDDYVFTSNIKELKTLKVDRKSISDLTGISDFESLEELYVEVNNLESLNLSKNINLTYVSADRNNLSCIELSEKQYKDILPEIYSNSSNKLFWSRVVGSVDYNKTIYNISCDSPKMDNIIFVESSNNKDYNLKGRDSKGNVNGLDPTLNFNKGDAIYFYVNADGNGIRHYFHLKTSPSTGTGNQISIPSGTYKGEVIWKPQEVGTYYYQCRIHSGHGGIININ